MKYPKDSSQIYNSKITFTWDFDENENLYYVFLKNVITQKIIKIETNGSQLSLFDKNPIFEGGDSFEWMVSSDEFPNLKNIHFYQFKIINRHTYKEKKRAFTHFIKDLKQIGTQEAEIETILCERFYLCK